MRIGKEGILATIPDKILYYDLAKNGRLPLTARESKHFVTSLFTEPYQIATKV